MKLQQITVAAACIAMLAACQKDKQLTGKQSASTSNQLKNDPYTDDTSIGAFFEQQRNERKQTFVVSGEQGGHFQAEGGTTVVIAPGSLRYTTGQVINGPVTIEVIENYSAGVAILTNRIPEGFFNGVVNLVSPGANATAADMPTAPLITDGSVYINATTQDKKEVVLSEPITITIPAGNVGAPNADQNMKIWEGVQSPEQDRDMTWKETQPNAPVTGGGSAYEVETQNWGWCNIDRFGKNMTGPMVQVKVVLPNGYDDSNTEVYLVFANEASVASLDTYNGTFFTEHYGYIPQNLVAHVVAMTMANGSLEYHIDQNVTFTAAYVHNITSFSSTTPAGLESLIDFLPSGF